MRETKAMRFANDDGDLTPEERTLRAAERMRAGGRTDDGDSKPTPIGDPKPAGETVQAGSAPVGRAVLPVQPAVHDGPRRNRDGSRDDELRR